MTLQDLRYLVALADHGHFGRAAAACHISQPTLSTQIRKLERFLGASLFERASKALTPTPLGADVIARARQVIAEADAIVAATQHAGEPLAGPLALGIIPTLAPYMLGWLIPALAERYPKLRLAVHEDVTARLLALLANHQLDAALLALPLTEPGLESLALFDEPFWLAAPATHRLASRNSVSEEDLKGERLLLLAEGHCLRDQALALCGAAAAEPRKDLPDLSAASLETVRQMAAIGIGCTLLPAMAVGERREPGLALRPLGPGLSRRIGLAWRRTYPYKPALRLLARLIRARLPASVHPVDGD
ncbi:MAG TPA: LysR substrate-binding domain-containing protein [Acetobacteraceae bacterium]|nr:LysR substrate-binding domain-containing protein [Acetobacteraceae bacterium]